MIYNDNNLILNTLFTFKHIITMTKRFLLMLFLFVLSHSAWCNGDPVAVFSALTVSRNPVAVHVPEVQLKDEHLTIIPLGQYTIVRVE